MSSSRLYPIFAELSARPVLVVGGGAVAQRKVAALLESGADVRIGAPVLNVELAQQVATGRARWIEGSFAPDWFDGVWLAIAATDDVAVNAAVAAEGERRRVFVNVVDDAARSTFQVPAVVDRAPLVVAISSGGAAPVLARLVREKLESLLDPALGSVARLAERWRSRIRGRLADLGRRRRFLERVFDGPIADLVRRGQDAAADAALARALDRAAEQPLPGQPSRQGSVVLVGAGPGDPGLLTLKGLRALNDADVILHDRLVSADVLKLARRDALFVEVAKEAGDHRTTQDGIHALMLEHARAGRRVVRLKGGDPFVFGRGGEELEFLRDHGIDYEVVPGITAALACAAYAGIPLTHRDHAQSVRLVTAHCKHSLDTLDWRALAAGRQTLAVYMGVTGLDGFAARLIDHGRAASTPAALVENGSRREQRVVLGRLDDIAQLARDHAVRSPALLIVGEVAALGERLHWHGAKPLRAAFSYAKAA